MVEGCTSPDFRTLRHGQSIVVIHYYSRFSRDWTILDSAKTFHTHTHLHTQNAVKWSQLQTLIYKNTIHLTNKKKKPRLSSHGNIRMINASESSSCEEKLTPFKSTRSGLCFLELRKFRGLDSCEKEGKKQNNIKRRRNSHTEIDPVSFATPPNLLRCADGLGR